MGGGFRPKMGHTSVGRVGQYIDLVVCVLVLVAVGRGRLTRILESQNSCRALQDRHSRASESRLPRS